MYTSFAFIPARSGSKRLNNKNIINLGGHPLLAYTVNAAIKSGIFTKVIVVTDIKLYEDIAKHYGAESFGLRPKKISGYKSQDYLWLNWIDKVLTDLNINYDIFSILRPTSPFRSSKTIIKAYKKFINKNNDSIRAVELTSIHPGKIWKYRKNYITPLIKKKIKNTPWHSSQYSSLPKFYAQNASLEIAWRDSFLKYKNISGNKISPYFSNKLEGFDINNQLDYEYAKIIIKNNIKLDKFDKKSWFND